MDCEYKIPKIPSLKHILLTISFSIFGCILAPRSGFDKLKRQAVAAIWIGNTVGYSLAHSRTF